MSAPTIDHLLPYPATLLRRTADFEPGDEYGDPTWEEAEEPTRCWLEPMGSREEAGLGEAVQVETFRLFLPPATPPRGWDAIRLDDTGLVYELEGDAFARGRPQDGAAHHLEAYVRVTA